MNKKLKNKFISTDILIMVLSFIALAFGGALAYFEPAYAGFVAVGILIITMLIFCNAHTARKFVKSIFYGTGKHSNMQQLSFEKLNIPVAIISKDTITNGDLELDTSSKQLRVSGEEVRLTATEYKIVELLMKNAGRVFSAEEIYSRVWNEEAFGVENTVMVHIRRIREKIEINPKEPKYLKVVWGIGYKIEKHQP